MTVADRLDTQVPAVGRLNPGARTQHGDYGSGVRPGVRSPTAPRGFMAWLIEEQRFRAPAVGKGTSDRLFGFLAVQRPSRIAGVAGWLTSPLQSDYAAMQRHPASAA